MQCLFRWEQDVKLFYEYSVKAPFKALIAYITDYQIKYIRCKAIGMTFW